MAIKGGFLRLVMITCYFLAFCCATIITGAFAWFTATQLGSRNIASLAIGALTMFYTLTCAVIVCCTAGIGFFAIMSIIFDGIFIILMAVVAGLNRSATNGCDGPFYPRVVYASFGRESGPTGCQLFVAAFAVAIIAIFLFVITMVTQFIIRRRNSRGVRTTKGESALRE